MYLGVCGCIFNFADGAMGRKGAEGGGGEGGEGGDSDSFEFSPEVSGSLLFES